MYETDGALIGYHQEPAVPGGRTAEELAQDIEWFKQAFELPILTREEVEAELAQQPSKPRPVQRRRKRLEELEAELESWTVLVNRCTCVWSGFSTIPNVCPSCPS